MNERRKTTKKKRTCIKDTKIKYKIKEWTYGGWTVCVRCDVGDQSMVMARRKRKVEGY